MQRSLLSSVLLAAVVAAGATTASAQDMGAMSDQQYIAAVSGAAPAAVVQHATIVRMAPNAPMKTLQTGTNGFTCMMPQPGAPMCADKPAMVWGNAYMTHATPPSGVGFVYMLAGDQGASNLNPYDTAPSASNHWIKSGPHVMIVGSGILSMGYPTAPTPDPTQPYVMWAGTPYAHLMIPVLATPM